jgi:SsrA-binding protein
VSKGPLPGTRGAPPLVVSQNKKARHDYALTDFFEAGLVLTGTEVKSLRLGRATLTDSYATVRNGEAWLLGAHIPEYTEGTWTNHAPRRERKLLLNKHELKELEEETSQGGKTLVPLRIYFKDGHAKVELGVGTGKKSYDKRQDMAERDSRREVARELGRRAKGRV